MRVFEDLGRDLRFAARMLRRNPAFTAMAVLSLALGVGANTAIFTVIDALMLRSLAVDDPGRLILVGTTSGSYLQYSTFEQLRDAAVPVADLSAVIRTDRYNVGIDRARASGEASTIDGGPVRLALVSGTYFSTLGAGAALGRALAADDDRLSGPLVAVISDDYWNRRFNRSSAILGRTLTFSETAYEVVGVMPRGFIGEWIGRPADLWIPIVRQPQIMVEIPVGGLQNASAVIIGRMRSATMRSDSLQALLQVAFERVLRARLGQSPTPRDLRELANERIAIASGQRGFSPQRESFGRSLAILMSAVGLVLLVACANIANLLLARSEARRREMAVRLAVGASRGRLVRQVLTESVLLAAAGGGLGVLAAQWATASLAAFARSGPVTGASAVLSTDLDVHPDARMLIFTAALCVLTGILCGLAPAFRGTRLALSPALMARGSGSDGPRRGWFTLGNALVVVQVAVSLVLVIGAGLLVRTLRNLTSEGLGFDRERVLLVWALPGQTGGRGAAAADFWRAALDRVQALPGVVVVSASNQGVLNGSDLTNIGSGPGLRIEGEPAGPGLPGLRSFVAPGFFKTMGIPLVSGRDFTESDVAGAPRGVIVSRAMARHYFGERDPIGKRIWFPEDTATPTVIIGVAGDFLVGGPRETAQRPGYTYFSYRDREASRRLRSMMMAVRTAGDPMTIAESIRRTLQGAPLDLPILKIDSVGEQLSDVLVQERMVTTMSAAFGVLSLALACLGLHGVISYTVARRTNEIGLRMALGATRGSVLTTVMTQSLALVSIGVVIGVLAAVGASRAIASRLFGISAADPATLAVGTLVVVAAAAAAAALPARRAARVDPMDALRCE